MVLELHESHSNIYDDHIAHCVIGYGQVHKYMEIPTDISTGNGTKNLQYVSWDNTHFLGSNAHNESSVCPPNAI